MSMKRSEIRSAAQTVSLSLYTMLAKLRKSAYRLQSIPFLQILYNVKQGASQKVKAPVFIRMTVLFLCISVVLYP